MGKTLPCIIIFRTLVESFKIKTEDYDNRKCNWPIISVAAAAGLLPLYLWKKKQNTANEPKLKPIRVKSKE